MENTNTNTVHTNAANVSKLAPLIETATADSLINAAINRNHILHREGKTDVPSYGVTDPLDTKINRNKIHSMAS